MFVTRVLTATVLAVGATTVAHHSALAAAPANDTPGGAVVVTSIPFQHTQDTTEATTDAFELGLNAACGAPTIGNAVWFQHVASADQTLAVDVTGSDYAAGIAVYQGSPAVANTIACGPGTVGAAVSAGETYWMMVFGDGLSPATGGQLVLEVRPALAAPALELTIDPIATVSRAGVVHVTGVARCTDPIGADVFGEIFGEMSQRVGRLIVRGFGFGFLQLACDGTGYPWSMDVIGDNGVFAGGKAASIAFAFACTDFCSETYVEQTLQLRRSGR